MKSNRFLKQPLQTSNLSKPTQTGRLHAQAASLTSRFLVGGEVLAREKNPTSILEARGTHFSSKFSGWATGGSVRWRTASYGDGGDATRSFEAAIGRLGR